MNISSFFTSGDVGSSIKSIQRGTISLATTISSATATITAVTTGKSELRLLGTWGNIAQVQSILATIVLTNSTTITASRGDGSPANALNVSWELTEWN